MASKHKRRNERPVVAGGGLRQEVERLIAKDRLKDAVKEAKLCYKQERRPKTISSWSACTTSARTSPENAMPSAGQEVAQHLIEFGITDPGLFEDARRAPGGAGDGDTR